MDSCAVLPTIAFVELSVWLRLVGGLLLECRERDRSVVACREPLRVKRESELVSDVPLATGCAAAEANRWFAIDV